MRDPNRIPQILNRLRAVWEAHPDLRLGQLLENAVRHYSSRQYECGPCCIYNIEDVALMVEIEKFHEELQYSTTGQYEVELKREEE